MSNKRGSIVGTTVETGAYWVSEKIRLPLTITLGLGMAATASVLTLDRVELKPLVSQQGEVSATELRPPVIERIEADDRTSYATVYSDITTQVNLKKVNRVSGSLPFAEAINKGTEALAGVQSVTFNKPAESDSNNPQPKSENGVLLSVGTSGFLERTVDLDARQRLVEEGETKHPVIKVRVSELSVAVLENRGRTGAAYASSNNFAALPGEIGNAFNKTFSDGDVITKADNVEHMMKMKATETANQAAIDKCLGKNGEPLEKVLETVSQQIKKQQVEDFAKMRADEPKLILDDVEVEFDLNKQSGEKNDLPGTEVRIADKGRSDFNKSYEAFVAQMKQDNFEIFTADIGTREECRVSENLKKLSDEDIAEAGR